MAVVTAPPSALVDINDPPVPQRNTPITEMSAQEKLQIRLAMFGIAVVCLPAAWWLFQHSYTFWSIVSGLLGLFCLVAGFSGTTLKAACPYCGNKIDGITVRDRGEGKRYRCQHCSEYSVANGGLMRPLDPSTVSDKPEFESPVFQKSVWPRGCVVCGAPPTHFDDLSKTTIGAVHALMGRIAIVRGSVKGVPHCDKHRESLQVKIGIDKKLYLAWTSLRMMRRYLAANRAKQVF